MANKTYIPAFKSRVGDWNYYICQMKYAEVKRSVSFAFELGGNRDLSSLIQRGISARTQGIVEYLLESDHRFLGSLIVATWGGDPEYIGLRMEDPEGMLSGLDREFGVLTLDGTHQFFALDGQHRLKAIKDALLQRPELGSEDICVLLVTHHDTKEGRERTQRLFTNINRNAKSTNMAENIALDVDDSFAILTRRLLTEHPFLSQPKRVRVFSKAPSETGEFALAGKSISKTDPAAWSSITVLYDLLHDLAFGLPDEIRNQVHRPSDSKLEEAYLVLAKRIDDVLAAAGNIRERVEGAASARDLRAPKAAEESGHAMMRPVVQQAVCQVLAEIQDQRLMNWRESLDRLASLDWTIGHAPWTSIFNPETKKIMTGKEDVELLRRLLHVHLAPQSRADIKRARTQYKQERSMEYPVSEEKLATRLAKGTSVGEPAPT
jgi:DNA sulfur modification protein DndB